MDLKYFYLIGCNIDSTFIPSDYMRDVRDVCERHTYLIFFFLQ